MTRYIFILCSILILASCEDKKSSSQNTATPVAEESENKDSVEESNSTSKQTQEQKQRPPGPLLTQEELIPFLTKYGQENPEDKIRIKTRFGNIEVELFHDTPLHRANFIFLVKHDYFDETFFHRVAEGFVVQGGNSDNPSTNKKRHYIGDYLIPSEFEAGHKHVRGAFSAAKYAEQNVSKASSPFEFFIVQSQTGAHHLNNDHTVFGRVVKGMDVVDEIAGVKVDQGEWPLQNIYLHVEILE